jgi:predicted nucleic acid-binding protein
VAPFEDPAEYEALVEALRQDFHPQTTVEELLIQQIAGSLWRRQRLVGSEKAVAELRLVEASLEFDRYERLRSDNLYSIMEEEVSKEWATELATLKRYRRRRESLPLEEQARLTEIARNPPKVEAFRLGNAREECRELEATAERRKQLHVESQVSPHFSALKIRYDSSLERQFYRALVMLLKLQETRTRGIGFVSQE